MWFYTISTVYPKYNKGLGSRNEAGQEAGIKQGEVR